jgi:hypothetical protein
MEHPEIFPVRVACICADAGHVLSSKDKIFVFGELFLQRKEKYVCEVASVFFIA